MIYEAAVSNRDWYIHKFGNIPSTVHDEKQYLTLEQKYYNLKSEYDDLKEKYDDKMKAASFGL
jgi:hypothetical protein